MKFGFQHIVLSTALFGLTAPVAMAQSVDNPFLRGRYTAVTERSQGDFDPEPLRAGAFEIWSSLGLAAAYNSNIFAAAKDADNDTNDTIISISPQIAAQSNWSSHELNAGFSLERRDYLKFETETVTDYDAFVGGRIDVLRDFALRGQAFAGHGSEPRFEPGSAGAATPIEFDRTGVNAGAVYQRDRFQLEGTGGTIDSDYDSTTDFRDVTENFISGRVSYAISPDVAAFLQGRTGDLDYDAPGTTDNPNRDGTRSSVEVGASFELQAPFRGEIAVGSFRDEKDSPSFVDSQGLSVDANLVWFPTQLTTVTFRANRGAFDAGIRQSSTATNTTLAVRIIFAEVGRGNYKFEGSVLLPVQRPLDRKDEFSNVEAGIAYKLNKRARLEASYRFHSQSSTGIDRDRDLEQHVVSVGLRIYP
jgi:hypothetical protein